MIKPSKAVIAGAAIAGLLSGSLAAHALRRAHPSTRAFRHRPSLMPKRVNTCAKARTPAKAREAARLTEARHLKHMDETAVVWDGPEF
jgi:hypothetical protein